MQYLLTRISVVALVTLLSLCGTSVSAQTTSCPNIGGEMGNFNNWDARVSNGYNQYDLSGMPPIAGYPNRHVIFNDPTPVPDPNACGNITRTPPGKTTSIRLGNDNAGCEHDEISYNITVTEANSLLVFDYAVILQDPKNTPHDPVDKPKFKFKVIHTATGLPIDPTCGEYEVYATDTVEGFRTCPGIPGADTRYRAWTAVGVDLRRFATLAPPYNEVTIFFATEDCGLHGHFGYAYIHAECSEMKLDQKYCIGDNTAEVTAPAGFSYVWENGETTQTIVIDNPVPYQTVKVKLRSVMGCEYPLETILIPKTATANFEADTNRICSGDSITFTDKSFGAGQDSGIIIYSEVEEWDWDFGDGYTSDEQNPTHIFQYPGAYNVVLKILTEDGCEKTTNMMITVAEAPVPLFTYQDVCAGATAKFVNKSYTNIGTINGYTWDFGDPTSASNTSTLKNANHIYLDTGVFNVELEVTTNEGCAARDTQQILIHESPQADFSTDLGCAEDKSKFFDQSTIGRGTISAWDWAFGDFSTSASAQNPEHAYDSAGVYNVTFTAISGFGCRGSITKPVEIFDAQVDFTTGDVCYGSPTKFNATSNQTITAWVWDFGDGNVGRNQATTHSYGTIGNYSVSVTARTDLGCSKTKSKSIEVFSKPIVNLDAPDYEGCSPFCVTFEDKTNSLQDLASWEWDFGDGNTGYDQHPDHCFQDSGTYSVKLIATTDKFCKDTFEYANMIRVHAQPKADFSFDETEIDIANTTVEFRNTSTNSTNFNWAFDQFGASSEVHPSFSFPSDPNVKYLVCLEAMQQDFCSDQICKEIIISDNIIFAANTFTPNGDGINDGFRPILRGFAKQDYNFYIFNRWGDQLFHATDQDTDWDGHFKSQRSREGVYVWKVLGKVMGPQGGLIDKEVVGHITILHTGKGVD